MSKYLISAYRKVIAEQIARDKDIQPRDWKYIPDNLSGNEIRERALRGLIVDSEEFLIGYFSEHERFMLLRFNGS